MGNRTIFKMETPSLPEVPDKVMIYKTIKSSEEDQKKQTESLASSLNMRKGTKALSETPERLSIEEGDHVLETYKESGAIWYGDMSRLWQETPEPMDTERMPLAGDEAQLEDKARTIAESFLEKNNLLPKEAHITGLDKAEFAELKPGEEPVGKNVVTGMQVDFGFELDGIPAVGPGAKINVSLGTDQEVVGFFKSWRDVEKDKEISIMSPEKALEAFQDSRAFAELGEDSRVSVKKLYLGYHTLPAFEPQDYLLPTYVFEGEVETPYFEHEFAFCVPAVSIENLKSSGILMDPGNVPLLS